MYLEIDEGFDEHPKTVRLCRVLGDPNAGQYLFRLWRWACRSAQDGDLSGMESADLEAIMRYTAADGKLFTALTEVWSQKFGPWLDREGPALSIHGWVEHQGAAIVRMKSKADSMKRLRDRRRLERGGNDSNKDSNVTTTLPEHSDHVVRRPDQTRPDQTRQERELPRARTQDPCTTVPEHQPPNNDPGKPTAYNVVSKFLAIRAELVVGSSGIAKPFSQPQNGDVEKAAEWLSAMPIDEVDDIEPAIRLACRHVANSHPGWTNQNLTKVAFLWASILKSWPDLREELHGIAPVLEQRQAQTRRTPAIG